MLYQLDRLQAFMIHPKDKVPHCGVESICVIVSQVTEHRPSKGAIDEGIDYSYFEIV